MASIVLNLSRGNIARQDRLLFADWRADRDIPHDHFWKTVVGAYFLPAAEHGHEARFVRDHPVVGPVLERWLESRPIAPTPLPIAPPAAPGTIATPPPPPPGVAASAVPEPSSAVLLGIALAVAAAAARPRGRVARSPERRPA
jgi:hypothetical protein